jgi:hypothetical protein
MRHAIEQCGQSLDVEIAGVKAAAVRRKDLQSARVTADERAQQLVVKTLRRSDDLVKLKLGRDVEIVANMAGLEIKIDERDLGAGRRLVLDQMDGRFEWRARNCRLPPRWARTKPRPATEARHRLSLAR